MEDTPIPTLDEQPAPKKKPAWTQVLQEWKAIAWSVFAAVVAALLYFLGSVSDNGTRSALGIGRVIQKPPIGQEYFVRGAGTLFLMMLYAAAILAFFVILRTILARTFRILPNNLRNLLTATTGTRIWGWVVVAFTVVVSFTGNFVLGTLARDADALILKSAKQIGTSWVGIGFDADQGSIYAYMFLVTGILIVFALLSWWILTRFAKSAVGRITYGTWAAINALLFLAGFAFLFGVSATFEPYPVVLFSNMSQYFGKDTESIFLDADDKLYAFLLILNVKDGRESSTPNKIIFYIPRTEVKWMSVIEQQPLHPNVYYHDLKKLLHDLPNNPAPGTQAPQEGAPHPTQ
jgi:hypothetical protein